MVTSRQEVEKPITECVHCGEACTDKYLIDTKHSFCCQGCKTVYELFHENGLTEYYKIESRPGISLNKSKKSDYSFLDQDEIKKQFLDFSDKEIAKVTFQLPQIYCASCIWLLENLYKLDEGITNSTVNFLKKEVYITFQEDKTSLSAIAALLQFIGFAPNINLASLNNDKAPAISKSLYYKIGLSGFLFGNIMLLSFPEYLGLDNVLEAQYARLFGFLNLLLSLPIVFYSGSDYLRSAWLGLKQGHLNIDVPISIGILSLFSRSAFEILSQTGPGFLDSLAGLIFFLLVGKWFQQKTHNSISFERDYQSYFPISASIKRGEAVESIALQQLKKGDRIIVRNEELIPADGMLLNGKAYIDYSFVTGESQPKTIDYNQLIYAGGRQMGGAIEMELTKKVSQSYLIKLWNDKIFLNKQIHQTSSRLADLAGKFFTVAILLIALTTLLFWLPRDVPLAINAFTSVLIIACPCAVALSIPFAFGNILRILSKKSLFLKNTGVIENVQELTHIVFDKTGTLTERFETMAFEGNLTEDEKILVSALVNQSGHPRSQQISKHLGFYDLVEVQNFEEIPGKGIYGIIMNKRVGVQKSDKHKSGTEVLIDGEIKGYYISEPQLRSGIAEVLNGLSKQYSLSLISGDADRHSRFFEKLFPNNSQMHFNQSPKDKLQYVKDLQAKGAIVMMVGDGLNDAGALKQADVGLVITEGNNNFSPACDGVLAESSFSELTNLLSYIQSGRKVIYLCYAFALLYNIVGLSFAVQGLLSPVIAAILMPLSSISIVLIGISFTWLLAQRKLSFENSELDLEWSESLYQGSN